MSFVDLGLIFLVILVAIIGLAKGFKRGMKSLVCFSLSLIGTLVLFKIVSNKLLSYEFIGRWVVGNNSLSSFFWNLLPSKLDSITLADIRIAYESATTNAAGEAAVSNLFRDRGISPFFMDLCYPVLKHAFVNPVYTNSAMTSATDIIALELSYAFFCLIVATLIFISLRLIIGLFASLAKSKRERRVGFGERLLGGLLGTIRGFAYSILILMILTLFTNFTFFENVSNQIQESSIAKPLTSFSVVINSNLIKSANNDPRYTTLIELGGY